MSASPTHIRILSVDDHELFREGLKQVVQTLSHPVEFVEASTVEQGLVLVERHADDLALVLVDLGLPDAEGLALLHTLREKYPLVPVAIVSASESPKQIRAALDAGAAGFVPKSANRSVLVHALELILAGEIYVPAGALEAASDDPPRRIAALTPRQRDVAALMVKGLTNKEIAGVLGIAPFTVKAHVAAILDGLDASNRTEAVLAIVESGLLDPS